MPDSGSSNVIWSTDAPNPPAVPAQGVSSASGATSSTAPAKPARGLLWVAPAVSGAVILGFFAMLSVLLYENYNPPAGVPVFTTPAAPNTPAAANLPSAPSTPTPPNAPAAANTSAVPGTSAAKNAPAQINTSPTPNASVPASPTGGTTTPNSLQNVLFTLLGALGAAFTQVVNYWLGSSKGSSDKTDLLAATNPNIGAKQAS